jgi:hypothetical protein
LTKDRGRQMGFNSSEGGRCARLVGSLRTKAEAWRLEGSYSLGRRRSSGFKINVMRDRPGGRSAAERAGLEVGMGACMVVKGCRHAGHAGGTQFQGERHAAGRHKAGRYVGAKQKQCEQPYACPRTSSPTIYGKLPHRGRTLPFGRKLIAPLGQTLRRSKEFFSADKEIRRSIGAWRCKTPGRNQFPIGPIRPGLRAIPPARQWFESPWRCRPG